ncbi:phosphoglycerate dehydrogenase-like enzyme [Okibacterium sp. HSC-33S16]|uniref:2-hydroxyacid dehydrogenase n=1 Tax=Okibacterium sp. HSC-33S16 TaxID=2910965 RepID=UPI00209E50B1|nr:NAD(P)-dependent oxidoreductase [Okibacterium sp. HSC-33S16]MCP2029945.1 phosphoglycerate dehydrogenase-like enzyme [Okibacterium sp. HSC-33S16]
MATTNPKGTRASAYRVAVTADVVRPDGSSVHGDLGFDRLVERGIDWSVLPGDAPVLPPEYFDDVDAVLVMGHTYFDAETVDRTPRLRHIARFGAGYETIDLDACTRAGVVVTNTPTAIRRTLSTAAVTMILGLTHHVVPKDRMVRESRWSDREHFRGVGLEGRTLGIVGFGSVGADVARLMQNFDMTILGTNRSGKSAAADELGVSLVSFEELLERSDVVLLTAALTPETTGMIDEAALARMKRSAFLVNVGRGKLVDTDALRDALLDGRIAGAGLDVFDPEPLTPNDPILGLDNVLLSPHALGWTDQFTDAVSTAALDAIIAIADGGRPDSVLNPEVFETEAWRAKVASD